MSDEVKKALAEGDSVWLKSGGPEMKVEAIDGETVLTSWLDNDGNEQTGEFVEATLTLVPTPLEKEDDADVASELLAAPGLGGDDGSESTADSRDTAGQPQEVGAAAVSDSSGEDVDAAGLAQPQGSTEGAVEAAAEGSIVIDPAAGDSETVTIHVVGDEVVDITRESKEDADADLDPEVQSEGADAGLGQASEGAAEAQEEKPEVDAPVPDGAVFGEKEGALAVLVDFHTDGTESFVSTYYAGQLVDVVNNEGEVTEINALDLQPGQNVLQDDVVRRVISLTYNPAPAETQEDFVSNTDESDIAGKLAQASSAEEVSILNDPGAFEADPVPEPEVEEEVKDLRVALADVLPADCLAAWTKEELLLYKEKGVWPSKTARGNWINDLRRNRALTTWSATELLDWAEEKVPTPEGVDADLVWEELYKRFKIPGNFSHEDATAFAAYGIKPELTKSGLLVKDAIRGVKALSHWTYAELRGALLGEFEHEHSEEDLLTQLRRRLGVADTFGSERLLKDLQEASQEANVNDTLLKSTLDEYAAVMTRYGANLTEPTAGKAQGMLNNAIRSVMKRDYPGFHEGWNILLDFVNTRYTQLFTPDKARRGWSQIDLSGKEKATFEDLLTLIIATRSPVNRQQQAQVYNIPNILRYITNENQRQNVLTFYSGQ